MVAQDDNNGELSMGEYLLMGKLDLVLNEVTELRILVDELTNKTHMWKEKAKESNSESINYIVYDGPSEDVNSEENLAKLADYLAKDNNLLSPFEAEVVKLTVAKSPMDFICSELQRHEKAVTNALNRAIYKVNKVDEIKKAESVMELFLEGPEETWLTEK